MEPTGKPHLQRVIDAIKRMNPNDDVADFSAECEKEKAGFDKVKMLEKVAAYNKSLQESVAKMGLGRMSVPGPRHPLIILTLRDGYESSVGDFESLKQRFVKLGVPEDRIIILHGFDVTVVPDQPTCMPPPADFKPENSWGSWGGPSVVPTPKPGDFGGKNNWQAAIENKWGVGWGPSPLLEWDDNKPGPFVKVNPNPTTPGNSTFVPATEPTAECTIVTKEQTPCGYCNGRGEVMSSGRPIPEKYEGTVGLVVCPVCGGSGVRK